MWLKLPYLESSHHKSGTKLSKDVRHILHMFYKEVGKLIHFRRETFPWEGEGEGGKETLCLSKKSSAALYGGAAPLPYV